MFNPNKIKKILIVFAAISSVAVSGCITPRSKQQTATLLQAGNATQEELENQVDYLAQVTSMRAQMYFKFEDNSYADVGAAEVYKSADSDIVVQRPANIRLKVEVPVIGSDVAVMTSDGTSFRVAILQDGGSGKNKKFVTGTNSADYSELQEKVDDVVKGDSNQVKKSANAFANFRPQHFTGALLVSPIDKTKFLYLLSTTTTEEVDFKLYKKKDPLGWVLRSYYLLDEFEKTGDGSLKIRRRFWFDRVGTPLLTRQQIFDDAGEIESDIVYGKRGKVSAEGNYVLPLRVEVTRPKEKYKMTLSYKNPEGVTIGKQYPETAFQLENEWNLPPLDLDEKLRELQREKSKGATAQENLEP
ncbi:MAG: hypothetical protein R2684_12575 [Pyrinomonadaceae bacterium]